MKWLTIALLGAVVACGGMRTAKAESSYEVVLVRPATADGTPGIFRVNVATGQVDTVWGWGPLATAFSTVPESAALPAGEYHIRVLESLDNKGGWEVVRFDSKSGRTWSLSGGASSGGYIWTEAAAPK